ncbi:MAG: winged helix-turn-helix transcriptional regulator [Candidatus Lokiarchaeota archaeon]|nr:winged helix-turn-helix transcriptional regulator [Candidatus Lokiarchaeota archaeon]
MLEVYLTMTIVKYNAKKDISEIIPKEKKIIRELIKDPRKSFLRISKNVDKTRQTTSKIFKRLTAHEKIELNVSINPECLSLMYYIIRVELKRNQDADYFLNYFYRCPKTFLVVHSIIQNQIIAIIYEEFVNKSSSAVPCCKNLIDPIQSDPKVNSCVIEGLIRNLIPNFIPLDNRRLYKNNSNSPCNNNCNDCESYERQCVGCPGSKYYTGNFIF